MVVRTGAQRSARRVGTVALFVVAAVSAANAGAIYFAIHSQPLRAAISAFSAQSGLQVIYYTAAVPNQLTNEVVGRYDVREGLSRLLRGTDLIFDFVNERTVAIRTKSAAAAEPKTGSTSTAQPPGPQALRRARPAASGRDDAALPDQSSAPQSPANATPTLTEEVVVVGTRTKGRTKLDSVVPVDVITQDEIRAQGAIDTNSLLQTVIPSFNVSAQPNTDAAAFMRPANLRGLPPDHTLVLINGKRWHRGAVITAIGGGVSDGAQGVDLASIPMAAVKRLEVLRDGAAAQYGSDAIAGVMNFDLNDSARGLRIDAISGQYREGDGKTTQVAVNLGFPLTETGFANLSLEVSTAGQTSRSIQRPDAAAIAAAGNTAVASPAQIWGSPSVRDDVKLFVNLGLDLSPLAHAYMFGGYSRRFVASNFYYRNPNQRGGVYSADGGVTRLVLDLNHPYSATNECAPLPVAGDVSGAGIAVYLSAQAALGHSCFLFNQQFPGGFQPIFSGHVADVSQVFGVRGQFVGSVQYDFSAAFGQSRVSYAIDRTINASLGSSTPTSFHPGEVIQSERTVNADFSKEIAVSNALAALNVGFGFEARKEQYEKNVGDPYSYANGPFELQGANSGSNGFGGISPNQAGTWGRADTAEYVDLETQGSKSLNLGAALRHEEFQEFGGTTTYKGSFLWRSIPILGVRGSYGTGFRAPTVGQVNNEQITTVAVNNSGVRVLTDQGTVATTNAVAIALGAKQLVPETSRNATIGLIGQFGDLTLTADYFTIKVKDRLAVSNTIAIGPAQIAILKAAGIANAGNLTGINFLVNNFDTTTSGLDVVASWQRAWNHGSTKVTGTFNETSTRVDGSEFGLVGADRINQLEHLLPKTRASLTTTHRVGSFSLLSRVNYYGTWRDGPDHFGAKTLLDVEATYWVNGAVHVAIGGQNILNTYPDNSTRNAGSGTNFDEYSPFGFNGGYWYLKVGYKM